MKRRHFIRPTRSIKSAIKRLLKSAGVGVTRYEKLEKLRSTERAHRDIDFLRSMYRPGFSPLPLEYLYKSLELLP